MVWNRCAVPDGPKCARKAELRDGPPSPVPGTPAGTSGSTALRSLESPAVCDYSLSGSGFLFSFLFYHFSLGETKNAEALTIFL